jgi:eukaryotic-like serine/threonine-protein kinase
MPDGRPLNPGDPERLGSYTLISRLGEGGQGVVYLGESLTGEPVAVKLLRADLAEDDTARARFLRELDAVKRVARFCTAQVLDADVEGDRPYIVSEYVPGPSLSQLVASESPRSGADLERLAVSTVTALVAIHEAGIVHRDFKPQNVLIGPDGPRVIDFGIARALDAAATMTNSAIGTPAYMAPEQLTAKDITPAADIFSWASTMVYAATGKSPFGQDTVMAVVHRIMNEPPDLGDMEEPLRGIVADCLAKDPAQRPGTQALLMRLLGKEGATPAGAGAVIADPATEMMADTVPPVVPAGAATTVVGTAAPAGPAGRRRTVAAALAGLLLAAGVAAVVIWAATSSGDHPSRGDTVQPPAPSSQPASSAAPNVPASSPRDHRSSSGNKGNGNPEHSASSSPTATGTSPTGGTTPEPPGGSTGPGDGGGGGGGGGGGPTGQPVGGGTQPALDPN